VDDSDVVSKSAEMYRGWTGGSPDRELEEASTAGGGGIEGGSTKSPFINFDEEDNHKTT
jgi:hypothetical protein